MFAHTTLGTYGWPRAALFYGAFMDVLEVARFFEHDVGTAYGKSVGLKTYVDPSGLRSYDHPNYYGAYMRDPAGNTLQAVCHSPNG